MSEEQLCLAGKIYPERRKKSIIRDFGREMGKSTSVIAVLFLICTSLHKFVLVYSSSLLPESKTSQDLQQTGATSGPLKQSKEHDHEVHCSRERSRAAWKIIEDHLMPFVEREKFQISSECRLHADNDLFRDQEQHKIHMDINEWQCGYCKKSFRGEKFLDQHFDNRHNNLLNVSNGKCLADLCGALHCDVMMNTKSAKSKCNPAAAARNQHLCESLANNCFPISQAASASRLHELFLRQFCDAHSCVGKHKPFSRGGKKQKSVLYLAISILTLMLLPIFYVVVYLHQRELKNGRQELRRISKVGQKTKPS